MRNLFTFLGLVFTVVLYGQAPELSNLSEVVKEITSSDKKPESSEKKDLQFDLPNLSVKLKNYTVHKSATRFSIVEENENVQFHINGNAKSASGVLYEKEAKKGYKITMKGENVDYELTPMKEIVFVCGSDHDHVEENKTSIKALSGKAEEQAQLKSVEIGNSDSETDVLKLESKPGAQNLIYLEFSPDGSKLPGWTYTYSVMSYTDEQIRETWEVTAEAFALFDVNVTTNKALFDAHPTANKTYVVHAVFNTSSWSGIAKLNSWGTGTPCLNKGHGPLTAVHELGHVMGLSHDGNYFSDGSIKEYYSGHGSWRTFMGSASKDEKKYVSHWSKGEYSGANNTEDDIQIMTNKLGLSADLYPIGRNIIIENNDSVLAKNNRGIIIGRNDVDTFYFEMNKEGFVQLNINSGSDYGYAMLNAEVTILDENKNEIVRVNPNDDARAFINELIPAGKYQLLIDGAGEAPHQTQGFSDYSSWGHYVIEGVIQQNGTPATSLILTNLNTTLSTQQCGGDFTPEISVKNEGSSEITTLEAEVYVGNVLLRTETLTGSILTGEEFTFALDPIDKEGANQWLKVKVTVPNSTESNLSDNVDSANYSLAKGKLHRFETNYIYSNGNTQGYHNYNTHSIWNVLDEVTGDTIVTNFQNPYWFNQGNLPDKITLDYCIPTGCFDFEMTGDLERCNYPAYDPANAPFTKNDTVLYSDGEYYAAKWWNNDPPTANSWEKLSDCPTGDTWYKVIDLSDNSVLVEGSTANGYVDYQKDYFCNDISTSSFDAASEERFEIVIYPNPSNGEINIKSNGLGAYYQIFNLQGQVVANGSLMSELETIHINNTTSAYYLLKVTTDNTTETYKIFIR